MNAAPPFRILMVEDEEDIRSVARFALEALGGFQVQTCGSAVEALELVSRCAPDLILMDVMMPHMDGPAALRALRARDATRGLPVVFMTAKAQPQEVARYRAMGALDVIAKPFDPMTLPVTVRSLLENFGMRSTALQERLGALRLDFARRLLERFDAARAAVDALDAVSPDPEALRIAYRHFHSLVGSAGTYGYTEVSRIALIGETILRAAFEQSRPPSTPDIARLRDLLVELRNVGVQTIV